MARIDTLLGSPETRVKAFNSHKDMLGVGSVGSDATVENFGRGVALNNFNDLVTSSKVESTLNSVIVLETNGLEINVGVADDGTGLGTERNDTGDVKARKDKGVGVVLTVKGVSAGAFDVANIVSVNVTVDEIVTVITEVKGRLIRRETPCEGNINSLGRKIRRSHADQVAIIENSGSSRDSTERAREGLIIFKSKTVEDNGLNKARSGPVFDGKIDVGSPMPVRSEVGTASV